MAHEKNGLLLKYIATQKSITSASPSVERQAGPNHLFASDLGGLFLTLLNTSALRMLGKVPVIIGSKFVAKPI